MASSLGWISNEEKGTYESDYMDFNDLTQYTVEVEIFRYKINHSILILLLGKSPFKSLQSN